MNRGKERERERESDQRQRESESRFLPSAVKQRGFVWLKCEVREDTNNFTQSVEKNQKAHTVHVFVKNIQVSGWKDIESFCFRGM